MEDVEIDGRPASATPWAAAKEIEGKRERNDTLKSHI